MRPMRLAITVLLTLAGVSCVPIRSVFPFFFEEDVVFDERLAGEWWPCEYLEQDPEDRDPDESAGLVYSLRRRKDSAAYELKGVCRPKESEKCEHLRRAEIESSMTATLFTLGGRQYLDVVGVVGSEFTLMAGGWTMSATHSLFKVALSQDRMKIAFLDDDAVRKAMKNGHLTLAHRSESEDDLLLTAPTKTLRRVLLKSAEELGLLQELDDFCRVSQEPESQPEAAPYFSGGD